MKLLQCGTWLEAEVINEEINKQIVSILEDLKKIKKIDYQESREYIITFYATLIIKILQYQGYTFDIDSYGGCTILDAMKGNIYGTLNSKDL